MVAVNIYIESTESRPAREKMSRHSETSLSGAKVLSFLFAFRICNALLLRTFFQPDEYFQSLEPAWSTAFGETSGAWITWVRYDSGSGNKVEPLYLRCLVGMETKSSLFIAPVSLCRRVFHCQSPRQFSRAGSKCPLRGTAGCPQSRAGWVRCFVRLLYLAIGPESLRRDLSGITWRGMSLYIRTRLTGSGTRVLMSCSSSSPYLVLGNGFARHEPCPTLSRPH